MKKSLYILIILSLFISACVNEDFEETFNKTAIRTNISIPLGYGDYFLITDDFSGSGSTIPGTNGITYYNDIPYTQNNPFYVRGEPGVFSYNLNDIFDKNVESCSFRVNIFNSFPTNTKTQVYIISNSGDRDSVFLEGPKIIQGGQTDTSGRVIKESVDIFDISFENRMDILKNAASYEVQSLIYTQNPNLKTIRFYDTSRIKVIIGARFVITISNELQIP